MGAGASGKLSRRASSWGAGHSARCGKPRTPARWRSRSSSRRSRREVLQGAVQELLILQRVAHPRVVAVLDVFVDRDAVRLVFEHGGQALHGLLTQGRPTSPNRVGPAGVQLLWRQCLEGLAWIHSRGVIHADLSPDLSFPGSIGPLVFSWAPGGCFGTWFSPPGVMGGTGKRGTS